MRRYVITLMIVAISVGALFRAADVTGIGLLKMAGTIGILLFGVVGTLAISRYQSRKGLEEVEAALKSLEPDCIITDWAYQGEGRPDYLVVAPGGIVAVSLDESAKPIRNKTAELSLDKAIDRLEQSVRWLRDRLTNAGGSLQPTLGDRLMELPVKPILVLTRRAAVESEGAVTVCNPQALVAVIRPLMEQEILNEDARVKLTRIFRRA